MKVSIKDYQAIRDATLEFNKGITAIIGQTNSGKSSIVRAIEGAINNRQGNSFVNYNADKTVVEIEDGENKIIWTKAKKGDSSYNINGNHLLKIGKNQLEEVGELLNMSEVEVNGEKVRLNFWKQMLPPFLLNKTSNQLFEFISKSKEQELVASFQQDKYTETKNIDKDILSINAEIDSKTRDEVKYNQLIESLKPAYDFNFELLKGAVGLYKNIQSSLNDYEEQDKISLENYRKYDYLKSFTSKLEHSINGISEYMDNILLTESIMDTYNRAYERYSLYKRDLESYESSEKSLKEKEHKLSGLIKSISEHSIGIEEIDNIIEKYSKKQAEAERYKKEELKIEEEILAIEEELSKIEVCPYCGSDLKNHKHEV